MAEGEAMNEAIHEKIGRACFHGDLPNMQYCIYLPWGATPPGDPANGIAAIRLAPRDAYWRTTLQLRIT